MNSGEKKIKKIRKKKRERERREKREREERERSGGDDTRRSAEQALEGEGVE